MRCDVQVSQAMTVGRERQDFFEAWVEALQAIASKPYNVVGANNLWDVEYIK